MKNLIVLFLLCNLVSAQDEAVRTVILRNGDKLTGTLVSENDSSLVLRTSFGEFSIAKSSIKPQMITVYLNDGNVVSGELDARTDSTLRLRSFFGPVMISLKDIERTSEGDITLPGTQKEKEFLYAEERLIDIFFDPTGYTMEKGAIYFSGLSWGVALSENVDISSSYWRYFLTDLNIRPKFRLWRSGDVKTENAFSIGFHFHTAGQTGKRKYITVQEQTYDWATNRMMPMQVKRWEMVGRETDTRLWTELFAAFTRSVLKENGQGRVAVHAGTSVILHPDETMTRVWIAVENDITTKFKIIGQLYYDPYQPSYRQMDNSSAMKSPLDLDFGFVYAYNENLRFGIHYQPYIILFYFKF